MHKFAEGDQVVIADRPDAGAFAGRLGVIYGWTTPSTSKEGPVNGEAPEDFAWSVYFEDSEEQAWFVHDLLTPAEEQRWAGPVIREAP
jgi:hypothetical protein